MPHVQPRIPKFTPGGRVSTWDGHHGEVTRIDGDDVHVRIDGEPGSWIWQPSQLEVCA